MDDNDQTVSRKIKEEGFWDTRNLMAVQRFIKPGDTVLNIGTHIGLEAIVLGKLVGPKGRLFAFEPFSVSHNMLLKNIYLNDLEEISTVYNMGTSNHYGQAPISLNTENTGGAGIYTNE